ncbi:hypothetical protein MUK42_03659 [Musa troglodytarum]|uniref:Uncharacterized protein n=1 Tax=Musa troglodytarum TaxID=320322 RepID=A0A9E7G9Q9_9LILI|nr:hypothetical protein MUK42_03659 [Musa troglodytarum]
MFQLSRSICGSSINRDARLMCNASIKSYEPETTRLEPWSSPTLHGRLELVKTMIHMVMGCRTMRLPKSFLPRPRRSIARRRASCATPSASSPSPLPRSPPPTASPSTRSSAPLGPPSPPFVPGGPEPHVPAPKDMWEADREMVFCLLWV